jgi:photosystem II stability/assembly factor-like uncharacterized protein
LKASAGKLAVIVSALIIANLGSSQRACSFSATASSDLSDVAGSARGIATDDSVRRRSMDALSRLPLRFEEIRGGASNDVKFISRGAGFDFSISPTLAAMQLRSVEVPLAGSPPAISSTSRIANARLQAVSPSLLSSSGPARKTALLRMRLTGANRRARVVGESQLAARTSYFIGKDPSHWQIGVANYERVKVEQVYRGVDLVYYGSGTQLEYDFKVAPGADFKAIRLRFAGVRSERPQSVRLDETGDLLIETPAGTLRHRKPAAYQQVNGVHKDIAASYVLDRPRGVGFEVGFAVGDYDKRLPLIIDPVLIYSTYFGSQTGGDSIKGVAVDAAGRAYIVGTSSSTLPTTPGALQPTSNSYDAFVAKLNAAGTAVEYVTYLGGSNTDFGESIAVDGAGAAYVTGSTSSNDFPTTANAFQSKAPIEAVRPFVARLNPTGTALVYSTNLGSGDLYDSSTAIAVDETGQATVVGYTSSPRFPVTPGALQPNLAGQTDAFVAKLNSAGSALVYSTYLGGDSYDSARGVAVDAEGNAYVAGGTVSTNFPTTKHAYQREQKGSGASFVAKITATGDRLAYSTLLTGDFQSVTGIAVDLSGNAYVIGYASFASVATPTTPGALQPVPTASAETFVMKLNNTGTDLVYSAFLGGSGRDYCNAIAVDSLGQSYVAGRTFSVDFPLMRPLQSRKLGSPLFKSTDGGANWDDVPALAFDIRSLVIDPQVSSTLYASTFNDIIKSTDGGATWRVIKAGLSGTLVIDPVRPATLYVFDFKVIYKSTVAGDDWTRLDFPTNGVSSIMALAIDPKRPDVLYVAVSLAGPNPSHVEALEERPQNVMFKSTDGGASWKPLDLGRPVIRCLAIDPQVTSTVYAATDTDGLLKSTDGGASWFSYGGNSRLALRLVAIDPTNSQTLYSGGIDGIQKSTDGGKSWTQTPLQSMPIAPLTIDPQTPSTLYVGNFDGLYKTTDGGASWRVVLDKVFVSAITLDPKQHSTIYAPAPVTSDAFVAKLNATGTALVYSTFLGGSAEDSAVSIAADAHGNAYIAGMTYSANLPVTPNAYQLLGAKASTGFVIRIADPTPPRVTSAAINGKKLLVSGEGFDHGAVITVNNVDLETQNDAVTPSALLISKKGGKQIAPGQTVTIRVRDADGELSEGFSFTRGPD